jgi:hypothetical protein
MLAWLPDLHYPLPPLCLHNDRKGVSMHLAMLDRDTTPVLWSTWCLVVSSKHARPAAVATATRGSDQHTTAAYPTQPWVVSMAPPVVGGQVAAGGVRWQQLLPRRHLHDTLGNVPVSLAGAVLATQNVAGLAPNWGGKPTRHAGHQQGWRRCQQTAPAVTLQECRTAYPVVHSRYARNVQGTARPRWHAHRRQQLSGKSQRKDDAPGALPCTQAGCVAGYVNNAMQVNISYCSPPIHVSTNSDLCPVVCTGRGFNCLEHMQPQPACSFAVPELCLHRRRAGAAAEPSPPEPSPHLSCTPPSTHKTAWGAL